jgi:hypothetical protein
MTAAWGRGSIVVGAVIVGLLASACSSSGSGSGSSSPGASSPAAAGSGVATADANIAALKANSKHFAVPPLPSKPPTGKVVASVNCTIPLCYPHQMAGVASLLGWKTENFDFDLTLGPADYVRAFTAAVNAHPDYIELVAVYPVTLLTAELAKAKAENIPVIEVAGSQILPGIVANVHSYAYTFAQSALMADWCISTFGAHSQFVLVNTNDVPDKGWADGFTAEVAKNGGGSTAKVITVDISGSPSTYSPPVISYLQEHPGVTCLAFGDTTAFEYSALKQAGVLSKVKIVLGSVTVPLLTQIRQGEAQAGITDLAAHQWLSVSVMAELSVGMKITDVDPVPAHLFRLATAANATPAILNPPNYVAAYKAAWHVG